MPALPQAVTGTPLPPKPTRDFNAERAALEQQRTDLTGQHEQAMTGAQQTLDEKRALLQAGLDQKLGELDAEMAKPNESVPLPENTAQHLDPKQLSEAASIWMTLGAFAGLLTRTPMTDALGNMTAAMKGAQEGDMAQFKQHYDAWDSSFKKAMSTNKDMLAKKKEILDDIKLSLTEKEHRLKLVDSEYGSIPQRMETSFLRRTKAIDSQIAMTDKSEQAADKIRESVDKRMQAHADKQSQIQMTKDFHDQSLEIQRQGLAIRQDLAEAKKAASGSAGVMGSREMAFTQRVLGAANQSAKILGNLVQLPIESSTGVFGDKQPGTGLMSASGNVLARNLTPQEAQTYQVMATGIQRNLAAIESMGLAPPGALTHQMESVIFKEGDTQLTKMHKLADIRQIIEAGLETMVSNPRVPDAMRKLAEKNVSELRAAVPFTQTDVIGFSAKLKANKHETLSSYMKRADATAPAATFGSEADAEAAAKSGKLRPGSRVIINGVPGTWH